MQRLLTFFLFLYASGSLLSASYADSLLNQLTTSDTSIQFNILMNLPESIIYSNSVKDIELLDKGILIASNYSKEATLIELLIKKVKILELQDKRNEGIELALDLQSLSKRNGNKRGEAESYAVLGDFCFNIKDYENSIIYYIESTKIYSSLSDSLSLSRINYNLGLIYRSMWQNPEALIFLKEAYEFTQNQEQLSYKTEIESLIGCTYIRIGEYDSALVRLNHARKQSRKLNLDFVDLELAKSFSAAYNNLERHDEAIKEADYGIDLALQLNQQTEYAEFLNIKAEIEKNRGNYTNAIQLAKLARKKAKERELKEVHLDGLRILIEANNVLGNSKQANRYFVEYHPLRNALEWERNYQQTADMQVKYETERRIANKQAEIAALEDKNKSQSIKLRRERLFRNLLILIFALILTLALLIINRWKLKNKGLQAEKGQELLKKKNLEIELQARNQELTSSTTFIAEKNKMLSELQEQLHKLKTLNKDKNCELDSITNEISRNINLEKDWQTMKMHFENVFPDFFTILSAKFPSLTPLDLKHCAYLKMKLSNKELSRILNIEPNSVKTLRYRLKKKLELTPEEDLFNFVESV